MADQLPKLRRPFEECFCGGFAQLGGRTCSGRLARRLGSPSVRMGRWCLL